MGRRQSTLLEKGIVSFLLDLVNGDMDQGSKDLLAVCKGYPKAKLVLKPPAPEDKKQEWFAHGIKWVDNYVDELWDMGIGQGCPCFDCSNREAVGGTIYLLDATAQKGRELVYLAKDRKTLAAAIRIYQRHRGKAMTADMDAQLHRGEDREEELARKEAAGLKEKLFALDPAMFRDEFTFWSPLLEEIERGMI